MRTLARRLAYVLGFAAGGVYFLLCSFAGLVALAITGGRFDATYIFTRVACRGIVRMMGWQVAVAPAGVFGAIRPCVYVGNHQSIMDVLLVGSVVPRKVRAVGKKEIAAIPLFGWFFRRAGNLVIDRGNSEDAKRLLAEAVRRVREEKLSVWFMPEGHRNTERELLPFKTGAFRLAADAQAPIVPVVAEPLGVVVNTRRLLARRGTLRISILPAVSAPRSAEDEQEVVACAARVREAMQAELDRLRATARDVL